MSVPAIELDEEQEAAGQNDPVQAADDEQDEVEDVKDRSVRPIGLGRR